MEARLGSCDTREFIMVPARELLDGRSWRMEERLVEVTEGYKCGELWGQE